MVRFLQPVVSKKNFALLFEDFHKKEMSPSSLSHVCEKEEVGEEVNETISTLQNILQSELLNINGNNFCKGYGTFGKGMYLYILYCLCFVEEI